MKRRIISYILIGSLSAMCLCGCGSNKTGNEAEANAVTESAENSGKETEETNTAGSSGEETGNTDTAESGAEETGNTDMAESGAEKEKENADTAGQNTNAAGTEQNIEDAGTNTDSTGTDKTAGAEQNAASGGGTADSDALDVSWGVIEQYGFRENRESDLSFDLKGDTLVDCGDFYTIEATFYKPVLVSMNHQVGDVVEIVTDELTGEKRILTYQGNGAFKDAENVDYYAGNPAASGPTELYCFSDDRVESAFYEGIIKVAKDAKRCVPIIEEETPISAELLSDNDSNWYNGVAFDDKKQAVTLTVYGD